MAERQSTINVVTVQRFIHTNNTATSYLCPTLVMVRDRPDAAHPVTDSGRSVHRADYDTYRVPCLRELPVVVGSIILCHFISTLETGYCAVRG